MTFVFSCCNCLSNYVQILVSIVALSHAARIHNLWISMKTRISGPYWMCKYGRLLNGFYACAISTKITYADSFVSSHWRSSHYAVRHVRNKISSIQGRSPNVVYHKELLFEERTPTYSSSLHLMCVAFSASWPRHR